MKEYGENNRVNEDNVVFFFLYPKDNVLGLF